MDTKGFKVSNLLTNVEKKSISKPDQTLKVSPTCSLTEARRLVVVL